MLWRKWHVVVLRRKHVSGQVPYPVAAGQRVQLVAAHGDRLVEGLHGGPAGGARVEAARHVQVTQPLIVLASEAVPIPLTGPASTDLEK